MSYSQNFDGSGSLPTGWTWPSQFSVTGTPGGGITPTSSPNVLACNATATNTHYFGVYGTADGNGGNVSLRCNFNATGATNHVTWGLAARGDSTAISPTSGTYYWAQFSPDRLVVSLYKVVSGVQTSLGSVSFLSLTVPGWYTLHLILTNTAIDVQVQRISDGFWMNSSGTFVSGQNTAIAVADGSISGSGYFGLTIQSRSDNAYADDFFEDVTGGTTTLFGTDLASGQGVPSLSTPVVTAIRTLDYAASEQAFVRTARLKGTDLPATASFQAIHVRAGDTSPGSVEASRQTTIIPTVYGADDQSTGLSLAATRVLECSQSSALSASRETAHFYLTDLASEVEVAPTSTRTVVVGLDQPSAASASTIFVFGPGYNVYDNTGAGDPIDYNVRVATISGFATTTWTSDFGLACPGTWKFGVRAMNNYGEEHNIDCIVTIILDANGNDITNRPNPPTGLKAFATANGSIKVEWWYPPTTGSKAPTGFHVYSGTGGAPDYSAPKATVLFSSGIFNTFNATLTGLTDKVAYTIGVRAYNATAEESNRTVVTATADSSGPSAVSNLTAVTIV